MLSSSRHGLVVSLRAALILAAAAPLVGCVADVDDGDTDVEEVGEVSDAVETYPATCAEFKQKYPAAGDGRYTLRLGHDVNKPWAVYCHNMASAPAEYLPLEQVGDAVNFSQYTAKASQGTSVRTRYAKVRIDPVTLNINISDQTFTTSTGQLNHGSQTVTSMPFGVAMSCDNSASGLGNIDLTGTPFAVASNEFVQGGNNGAGSSTYSSGGQVVSLTGGGFCGWTSSTPGTFNPFNQAGTFQLQLQYRAPATCAEIADAVVNAWDGHYTLYVGHDLSKPWTAYCHDMSSSPAEYLSLVNTGTSANFSQYTAGAGQGTNVRTQYTKVRVDPATLNVDIGDQTFATSTGQLSHGSETVTSMPFGVAMSCDGSASGVGNIDLTGLPFAVATSEFVVGGWMPSGTSTYSASNRVVNLTGGGYCGHITPTPGLYDPFNDKGDFQLALVYTP